MPSELIQALDIVGITNLSSCGKLHAIVKGAAASTVTTAIAQIQAIVTPALRSF
jgi:hypothetical protein